MNVNSRRGRLSEFGIAAAKGVGRIEELIEKAKSDAALPEPVKAAVKVFAEILTAIKVQISGLDEQIAQAHQQNERSRLLTEIPGAGKLASTAIVASLPDPSVFRSGRDFSAWLGITPRQNSTGGKEKLGAITRKGNTYIRRLLVLGATSAHPSQAQGGTARWDRRFARAKTQAARDGGNRQQARTDHLGHDDDG